MNYFFRVTNETDRCLKANHCEEVSPASQKLVSFVSNVRNVFQECAILG